MSSEIEPTAEDRARVLARLEKNPRESFIDTLVQIEARKRVAREEQERRRARLRKLSFGLFGR